MQTTKVIKKGDNKIAWYLIDAKGMNLGKLAVKISKLLLGKSKLTYAPNLFSGDNVVVINAQGLSITQKKAMSNMYHKHSGYPGGLNSLSLEELMKKNPASVIEEAVWGMVPKTKMGREIISHLYVYKGDSNPHTAQNLVKI